MCMGENRNASSEIFRRHFLAGALAVAGVPPLCCRSEELPPESLRLEGGRILVDLARAPGLRRAGAAFAIVEPGRRLNLILIHAGRGEYIAMDRACTHGGAMCTYNPKRRTVQCTSLNHAEFDLQGKLMHGRTHGDLRTYPVEVSGATLEIRLERSA
jgi:nitrite reductase/ring-hydroxylating ferredoxin subunit